MHGVKRFVSLLKEDFKSKLWLVLIIWYGLSMLCFLFAINTTIPLGNVRSMYVGAGNTSFFAAIFVLGIAMGITGFPYLYSGQKADIYFSLPFSRTQLFFAGYLNNFLIFLTPLVVCKIIFFRISLSMGYCKYEDSVLTMWTGCVVLVLGWLVLENLSMLSVFLTNKPGYGAGLLLLFLLGPDAGIKLMERMMYIFVPSFYRSDLLEVVKGYFSPLSLLKNATGVEEYVDGAEWLLQGHLPYIIFLTALTVILTLINWIVFLRRPVERKRGAFSFKSAEAAVRYICILLAVTWFVSALQVFSIGGFSPGLAVCGIFLGVPLSHGLLNVFMASNVKKFASGGRQLLLAYALMCIAVTGFFFVGKDLGRIPDKENVESMAVVLSALESGDIPSDGLTNMELTGDELALAYDWVLKNCMEEPESVKDEQKAYELLVKYRMDGGKTRYFRRTVPGSLIDEFGKIFKGEQYKKGIYESLRIDSLKYYEVRWTNGLETYTLDLTEEEREQLLKTYQKDLLKLTFSDITDQTPIGCFTFVSAKNRGDFRGYIYPGFENVLFMLEECGIDGEKTIKDYPVKEIVINKYLTTQGLLYDVRALKWKKEITDQTYIEELVQGLYYEGFCVDPLLNKKDPFMEIIVYYQDSSGKTVSSIPCMADVSLSVP